MRQNLSVCFVLAAVCLTPSVLAQTTTGSIVGTVTDPTGAAAPNAAVTVMNMGTGIAVKTSTDGTGNYVVTPLPVGTYSVTVEVAGFRKAVSSGVTVNVQDRMRVDITLSVGAQAETVEVTGAAPLLETDTSYIGQVVESKRITDLPLNGRYFTRLAVLTAGATPTASGARDEKTGGFSANGVRPYQNNYLLDGIDNNSMATDLSNDASFVIGPSPDAVAEFKVQTNSMSAEFGRSGGAVLNVTFKSGTNALHGTLFEFLRNSAFDAKNYFDPGDQPIPPFKMNQFGGTLGGPVELPHYDGRNRTFFFVDYQGTHVRTGRTFLSTVPSVAWRNGDFTGFNAIYDPATTVISGSTVTRQPFAGNRIPQARWDLAAKKLMDMFPVPNVAAATSASGVANNFISNPTEPDDRNQWDIRVDHKISDRDSMFARFSYQDQNVTAPGAIPAPLGSNDFGSGTFLNHARGAVLSETHIFTPRTINEFRAGFTRLRAERLQFSSTSNLAAQVGISGVPFSESNGGLPAFQVDGLSDFGGNQFQPTREFSNVVHLINDLSLIRGRHTIKIGVEYKPMVNFSILQPESPRGLFAFSGDFTRDAANRATGLGAADFLLGVPATANITSFISPTFQQPGYFFFIQDDFKVTRKLTLNLGLRYDFVNHPRERHDAQASFNLATGALDIVKGRQDPMPANFIPEIPINRNAPRELVPNDRNNFGPRVGFAYNARPSTVLRGGYGIFYSSYEAGPLSIPNPANNPPFFEKATFDAVSFATPNSTVNQLSRGFPATALSNPVAPELFAIDPNFRDPYVQHWNFGAQQEVGWKTVFEVSYAGSKGTKLFEFRNGNQAAPTADPSIPRDARRPRQYISAFLSQWCTCDSSSYHSLLAKMEKRFSNGLSFLAAYTFGKSIDEASQASLSFVGGGSFRDLRHPEWEKALSDFDIRHRFVVSYTYELPFGKGKRFLGDLRGPANLVVGGWQIMGIDSVQSGTPRTVRAGTGVSNSDGENRPDVVPGVSLTPPDGQRPDQWFNPAAFTRAAAGTFGNAGRNIVIGPGQVNVDLSLFKDFLVRENTRVQFRAEAFNLPNHANFRTSSMQNRFDRAGAGSLTAANPSRQLQFALKVIF